MGLMTVQWPFSVTHQGEYRGVVTTGKKVDGCAIG